MSPALQLRHSTTLISKPSHKFVSSGYTLRVWCAARVPKHEEVRRKKWGSSGGTGNDEETGLSLQKRREVNFGRRWVLAVMAWPLLIKHSATLV